MRARTTTISAAVNAWGCSMQAKLAIAPIGWTNDDMPELGGGTSLATCLSEARQAGYRGVEMGGKFPRAADELKAVLDLHGLRLAGGWYSGTLLDNDMAAEQSRITPQLELFKTVGAPCIVYGETAGSIQGDRGAPIATRRRLDGGTIRDYGRRMTDFAEWCADQGMPIAYHHHMCAPIETEADLDALMAASGPALRLLFDPGHMAFAGGDPLRIIDRHGDRISHVHAKDVRAKVLTGLDRDRESFLDAVLKGVFTVPGDGMLDFHAIARRLADAGYEGWFVVEAEQDPSLAPPLDYAIEGRAALSAALQAAGYRITED